MDFLKYLDVLIGLSVVMILLSPAVTAITQFFMFAFNLRSKFLRQGLTALIRQLDGPPVERLTVANGTVEVVTPRTPGKLKVRAAPQQEVTLTLMPRGDQEGARIVSGPTDRNGVATIDFFPGTLVYTANTATVSVFDTAGVVPGASVACMIVSASGARTAVALRGNRFSYPAAPARYTIECTVTNAAGALADCKVRFDFDPHDAWIKTAGGDGLIEFDLPCISASDADAIARAVLQHPMIRRSPLNPSGRKWLAAVGEWIGRDASGEVVQREEMTRILLEFAAGEGAGSLLDGPRNALIQCLKLNGIPNPAASLASIRAETQRLEVEKPSVAAHTRTTEAIITAAKSDYVGRINAWFDETMDRISLRYGTLARAFTIAGALLVAFATQIDSLDLLRRLSVDDKLRNSLVEEAKMQQSLIDHLDKSTTNADHDEIQTVRAARGEIEQSLAKLRSPQMAILPDHFIWQSVPRARLVRNPAWRTPASKFELVLGSAIYTLSPRWRRDPLLDLQSAIDDLKAPVSTRIERGAFVAPAADVARAGMSKDHPNLDGKLCLLLDDREPTEWTPSDPGVVVSFKEGVFGLEARDPAVTAIRLLSDCGNPFSNVLDDTVRIPSKSPAARPYYADSLVLTSGRLGALQLRYIAGKASINILNSPESVLQWQILPSLWGIILSWLLLSLGAPFWYDSLKDLLKLRSTLAGSEEAQKKDRQADTQSKTKAPAAK